MPKGFIRLQRSNNSPRLKHDIFHLIRIHSSRIHCFLMANLDSFRSTTSSRSVSGKLSLDTPVHGAEEIRRRIDRLTYGQNAVVLENDSLVLSKGFGELATFFVSENDTAEIVVDGVVFVESAGILISRQTYARNDGLTGRHPD